MIVRVRVLAEAPSRVWMAVSGTLGAATAHHVRRGLHDCVEAGTSSFFLDLRELRCTDGANGYGPRALFAVGSAVRFHLVGAPAEIRDCIDADPRFTLHSSLESAWEQWVRD
ncbi:hypothetical protein [Streptomyces fulvoviolaceus]|uniref:hypothetical protein n=1 Tax=Streptomyces fulvoviolaceus TaxID=285535 RepID=UPI0021BF1884|nr:hypothetical protein [Streptomyces fulvoviolaceus]MCT9081337.1 hypothetical protein [Streptomyces fulvoviolaceus]